MKEWKEDELLFLINNWNKTATRDDLCKLLGKSKSSVIHKAQRLGLYTKQFTNIVSWCDKDLRRRASAFLKSFRASRSQVTAHKETGLLKYEHILLRNSCVEYRTKFGDILQFHQRTLLCQRCGYIGARTDFYDKRASKKTLCKQCDKKQKNKYRNTLKGRMVQILVSCRHCRKGKVQCALVIEDLEKLWKKQKGLCYYTGKPMRYDVGERTDLVFDQVSADRLDSSKGYVQGNVVLCCLGLNIMKSDIPYKRFIELCTLIDNNHNH